MDQAIRNKLRNVVTQCRKLLEQSVTETLQGQFGILAAGKKGGVHVEDESRMAHLGQEDRACRKDLLDHLEHIGALGYKSQDALAQLVREIAFTHLNRFCAYKMMEARGLVRQAVNRGVKSQGFLFYLADHPEDEQRYNSGQQEAAYRHFLDWLGTTLSEEIGVLFNPNDPANRLYPPQRVLDQVIHLLGSGDIKPEETALALQWADIWSEDETIGWVYQYFTPKELRDKARKESAAPRNSYELAFRNQFFTPRYVVEFLTDNTLGRIWYEMRRGDTKLTDPCRYMVRRPNEVFLDPGQEPPPEAAESRGDLSQEELLKQPVHIPHRPKKDPRELKILDPACGSGHFLLYCFDLLVTIYDEAYDDPDLGPALKADYPDRADFGKAVPGLILGCNLHGIDIDLRATQIAALSLWLRCQRAFQEMNLKQDRPKITRSNLVCAESMPGEKDMLQEFIADLYPKVLGQLVEIVFDKMKLAGEAGSLLKIEEELRDAIVEAKRQWAEGPKEEQRMLFETRKEKPQQQLLFDVSGITEEQFWDEAEANVLASLHSYATKVSNGRQFQRRLFAEDAAHGFAFVDICQRRFDVVLMNPPFGEMPDRLLAYLAEKYPRTKYDLAPAFVERTLSWTRRGGRVGWISPRTWFALSLLEAFRQDLLYAHNSLDSVLDLGIGVLDTALVEVASCVAQVGGRGDNSVFVARLLASRNKEQDVNSLSFSQLAPGQLVSMQLLAKLPRSAFGYWFPAKFAQHLQQIPRFDANGGEARQGLATTADSRFLRCAWEVPTELVGFSRRWVPFAKGGEYEPYYDDIHLVIDYADDGATLKEYLVKEKGQKHWSRRIASADYYGRIGLTYPERTTSDLSLRPLPKGSIFSATGQAVFLADHSSLLCYLALSYTRLFKQVLELYVGGGDASESGSAARHYTSGILNEMRVPDLSGDDNDNVRSFATEAIAIRRQEFSLVEESCDFVLPAILKLRSGTTLQDCIDAAHACYQESVQRLLEIGRVLDEWACRIYGLSMDEGKVFLTEEVCPIPAEYSLKAERNDSWDAVEKYSLSELVEALCERHGYRRAFTKKAYWANRRLELSSHLLQARPDSLSSLSIGDVTRHLAAPTARLVSYALGVAVGRWDVRIALGERKPAERSDPFAPVPACSPGMLQGPDGLPATEAPEGYPIEIDWDGILVDDPDHPDDVIRRVRAVLEVIWKDRAEAIEEEACEILGVKRLRDYFRKPGNGGFWSDHVRRYSKSRRKAPIYWLLQSSKKNYALWLYYHRLDKDMLLKALVNYVEPKIRLEKGRVESLRAQKSAAGGSGKGVKQLDKEMEGHEDLLSELRDFEDKLRRAAELHLEPDLNDGVVLNIAPLRELVPWKEAQKYWDELLDGKYEWSTIGKQLREKGLVEPS